MVVRVTFRLNITSKSVKMYTIFLHLDSILAKILCSSKLNSIGFHQTFNERAYSAPDISWLLDLVTKFLLNALLDLVAVCLIAIVAYE